MAIAGASINTTVFESDDETRTVEFWPAWLVPKEWSGWYVRVQRRNYFRLVRFNDVGRALAFAEHSDR